MLGFGHRRRSALRIVLEDGSWGWYKACPGDAENPQAEVNSRLIPPNTSLTDNLQVIGSHLDHILGWNMVAPAVTREFTVHQLLKV